MGEPDLGPPPSDPCCTQILLQERWMGTSPNASPSSSGVGEQLAWGFQPLCHLIGTPPLVSFPKSSSLEDAEALHNPR